MAAGPLAFGPFRLDLDAGRLWRGDDPVPLAPRPFALLRYLAERPGRLVTKDELLDAVWPGVFVGDAVVKVAVREIRKALEDLANTPRFLETVHGRGYRFQTAARSAHLPVPLTTFIGRETELSTLASVLDGHRLVTLRGAGGVGKTRLAREAALQHGDRFTDGIWWVDLAGLDRPDQVVGGIAATLGIRDSRDHPIAEALAEFVKRRSLLLVLDNCEHVLTGCLQIVERLLRAGRQLTVLATSREPLGLTGEKVFVVPPLEVPSADADPAEMDAAAAMRLFLERAADADSSFVASPATTPVIAAICRHLDGLPLAIEIVAARAGALSPPDLLARVKASLISVARDRGIDSGRHRSLAAAFDWSYDLLAGEEQRLLQHLSIFPGTFSLDAAVAICGTGVDSVPDRLIALVDKSLVSTIGTDASGHRRYRLLEVIRTCMREKLARSVQEGLDARHASWFAAMAQDVRPLLNSATRPAAIAQLNAERDSWRSSLTWALESDPSTAIRLAADLWWWWFHTNQWREGRESLERALERSLIPDAHRAEALCGAGALAWFQGDHDHARERLDQAITVARGVGAAKLLARALDFMGQVEADRGQLEVARRLEQEALAVARTIDDRWETAITLLGLGNVLLFAGRVDEAEPFYKESVALCRDMGDPWALGMALRNLGVATRRLGRVAASLLLFRDSLQSLRQIDDAWFVSRTLEELSKSLAAQGDWRRATRVLGAAEAMREAVGAVVIASRRTEYDRVVTDARTALGDTDFSRIFADGRSLTREEAIDSAIDEARSD